MALVSSFPISSHGIMFALIELSRIVLTVIFKSYKQFNASVSTTKIMLDQNSDSSMVIFSQIPVTNEVKLKQNFHLLSNLLIGTTGIGFKTILWALFEIISIRRSSNQLSCHSAQ